MRNLIGDREPLGWGTNGFFIDKFKKKCKIKPEENDSS